MPHSPAARRPPKAKRQEGCLPDCLCRALAATLATRNPNPNNQRNRVPRGVERRAPITPVVTGDGGGDELSPVLRAVREMPADRLDERQSRPDCALRIVLMGLGIAEIHKHPVAQMLSVTGSERHYDHFRRSPAPVPHQRPEPPGTHYERPSRISAKGQLAVYLERRWIALRKVVFRGSREGLMRGPRTPWDESAKRHA